MFTIFGESSRGPGGSQHRTGLRGSHRIRFSFRFVTGNRHEEFHHRYKPDLSPISCTVMRIAWLIDKAARRSRRRISLFYRVNDEIIVLGTLMCTRKSVQECAYPFVPWQLGPSGLFPRTKRRGGGRGGWKMAEIKLARWTLLRNVLIDSALSCVENIEPLCRCCTCRCRPIAA